MNWSAEQILALSPDAASAKAGQALATARKMLVLSGGHQIDLFGEWNGEHYWPLSAFADGRFVKFG